MPLPLRTTEPPAHAPEPARAGDEAPESELVARAATDREAFAALYRRHYPAIARYVRRRVGDAGTAADLGCRPGTVKARLPFDLLADGARIEITEGTGGALALEVTYGAGAVFALAFGGPEAASPRSTLTTPDGAIRVEVEGHPFEPTPVDEDDR